MPVSDVVIPTRKIESLANMDLVQLHDLPDNLPDVFALSIRMEAVFMSVLEAFRELLAKDHEEIPTEIFHAQSTELVLGLIERYGVLALLAPTVLRILWRAQQPTSAKGPQLLRQVGERLSDSALARKGKTHKIHTDIVFKYFKPLFLQELESISRKLGSTENPGPEQMLEAIRTGEYPMLKLNLTSLQRFLHSQDTNPDLNGNNETAVKRLAAYGQQRLLQERVKGHLTPDWFYYVWIAWATNKRAKTIRREIQSAESKLRRHITRQIRVTKNR